jgi:oligopeptidase B
MQNSVLKEMSLLTLINVLLLGCGTATDREEPVSKVKPPVARIESRTLSLHDHERIDDYFWIRDDNRNDPEVLELLKSENDYTESVMAHTKSLQNELYREITGRLTTDDSTVPVKRGDYYYHREFRAGGEHPIYLRRGVNQDSAEIILDVNQLAEGHEYFSVDNWTVNNSHILAFAEDDLSRRIYTIRFKDLATGQMLPDVIRGASSSLAWANNNKTIFYVKKDPETLLPFQVYRHDLGTQIDNDQLVYEENDRSFYTTVYKTRSEDFIVISMQSTDSSEIHLIDASHPTDPASVFLPREEQHEYRIRHVSGTFYIVTNWLAENFRLMQVSDKKLGDKNAWQEVIGNRQDVLLQDVEGFTRFFVVNERFEGLNQLRVFDRETMKDNLIEFPEPAYSAGLHSNPEVDSEVVRYVYSSLITPSSVFDYDMVNGRSNLLKQDKVLGDFNARLYRSERISITARDGAAVPVSLVYRKDKKTIGRNPLYLYAYGSYGYSADLSFSSKRLSLLDRGFVYAIVHVRGGEEMGRTWYEQGKLLNKKNTFWDFIDATETLVAEGYGNRNEVFAQGASAGGLLMGVIANEAPDKYLGVVAHVPFVDVVTTMLDQTIPLTAGEFSEWGDPRDKVYYDYMLSYSPYDQVSVQAYPNIFVTTGLHDSQVQYFEPVKWVSKLRRLKQDNHRLLINVNMDTGHSGATGRYEQYRIDALEYAFILDVLEESESGRLNEANYAK